MRRSLVQADSLPHAELAALFTACYEGYFVPIAVDEAALAAMISAWDVDLSRSRVAVEDGVPVGLALLGVRGDRGWIGGMGVVPARRRSGVGRDLMEAVLAAAPPRVSLEVIEQNAPAIALYRSLGFEPTRILEVWSLTADVPAVEAREAAPAPLGPADLPWQRADESLPSGYRRLEVDGAAALIQVRPPRVTVLQLRADTEDAARRLLAAARTEGESLHYVNVPEGDVASDALRSLGGSLDVRQLELALPASPGRGLGAGGAAAPGGGRRPDQT